MIRHYIIDAWAASAVETMWLTLPTIAAIVAGRAAFSLCVRTQLKKIVNAGQCLNCRYPVVGLTPDENGLVHCPECGYCSHALVRRTHSPLRPEHDPDHATTQPPTGTRMPPVSAKLKRRFRLVPALDSLCDDDAQAVYLSVTNSQTAMWNTVKVTAAQLVLAAVAIVASILALDPITSPFPSVWSHTVAIVIVLTGALTILKLFEVRRARGIVLVGEAVTCKETCHACGYSLAGIQADEHGFARCPECLIPCRPHPTEPLVPGPCSE